MPVFVEQEAILTLFEETRAATLSAIAGLDWTLPLEEFGWRGADILHHLTAWELEVARALAAERAGQPYTAPESRAIFNLFVFQTQRNASPEQAVERWQAARADLIAGVLALEWPAYGRRLSTPVGQMFIGELAKHLIAHEQGHIRAVLLQAGRDQPYDTWGG
jgi:hypothetical protein